MNPHHMDGTSPSATIEQPRQNATDSDVSTTSSPVTGLTPQQEQAAALLITGKGVNGVADELGVHRSTLWTWRKLPTFRAYYNGLLSNVKHEVAEGLYGMYHDAIGTLRHILTSESAGAALKAAVYIIEQVQRAKEGETDPREIIKKECEQDEIEGLTLLMLGGAGEGTYARRCKELGIEP
jgi:hypothetical protein